MLAEPHQHDFSLPQQAKCRKYSSVCIFVWRRQAPILNSGSSWGAQLGAPKSAYSHVSMSQAPLFLFILIWQGWGCMKKGGRTLGTSPRRGEGGSGYGLSQAWLYFFLLWLWLHFSLPFPPSISSHIPLCSFKFTAFFFHCYCMHICVCICIYILKYNLPSLLLDNQSVYSSLKKIISATQHSLVACKSLCRVRTSGIFPYTLGHVY